LNILRQKFLEDTDVLLNILSDKFRSKSSLNLHHGIFHAEMVTSNALKILNILNSDPDINTVLEIIIAGLSHEIGMIETDSQFHGEKSKTIISKIIFELQSKGLFQYLSKNNLESIFNAVTEHDKKEIKISDRTPVSKIVFDADNADAFGFFGIFRYLAIYKERGWNKADMINGKTINNKFHHSILSNLNFRWEQFDNAIKPYFENEYKIANNFFSNIPDQDSWESLLMDSFLFIDTKTQKETFELFSQWEAHSISFNKNKDHIRTFFKKIRSVFNKKISWKYSSLIKLKFGS